MVTKKGVEKMLHSGDVLDNRVVFCGYPKSKIISRLKNTNTAYCDELYILSRVLLPYLREYALMNILTSRHIFISLENGILTKASKIGNTKKFEVRAEDISNITGHIPLENIYLWQLKMQLASETKVANIKFYDTSEVIYLHENNENYKIDPSLDHAIVCNFLREFIDLYRGRGVQCHHELEIYVKSIYPNYKSVDGERYFYNACRTRYNGDKIIFEKKLKTEYKKYGECYYKDYEEVMRLFALRDMNWRYDWNKLEGYHL